MKKAEAKPLPETNSTKGMESTSTSLIDRFRDYLLTEGKTLSTVKSYTGDIEVFIKFLEEKDITFNGHLERNHVVSYRDSLLGQNVRAATINTKINSLQSFNKFLQKNSLTKDLVVVLQEDKITNTALAELRSRTKQQDRQSDDTYTGSPAPLQNRKSAGKSKVQK